MKTSRIVSNNPTLNVKFVHFTYYVQCTYNVLHISANFLKWCRNCLFYTIKDIFELFSVQI